MNQTADLKYYPIALDVRGKNCLVVGGGNVGVRKALTLAKCGAIVRVVSPVFSDEFIKKTESHSFLEDDTVNPKIRGVHFCDKSEISCIEKHYDINDLDSMFLVVGATDNMAVNRRIAADANSRQILCNIADFSEGSSFVLPSIVHRGDLVITVSTSGNSPALAKKLRKELELQFGEEYAILLVIMGNIRKRLLAQTSSTTSSDNSSEKKQSERNACIFREIIHSDLLEKISNKDKDGVEKILTRVLGNHGYSHLYQDTISYQDIISGE